MVATVEDQNRGVGDVDVIAAIEGQRVYGADARRCLDRAPVPPGRHRCHCPICRPRLCYTNRDRRKVHFRIQLGEELEHLETETEPLRDLVLDEVDNERLDLPDHRLDRVEQDADRFERVADQVAERLQRVAHHAGLFGQPEHRQQVLVDVRVVGRAVAVGVVELMDQHVEDSDRGFGVSPQRVAERVRTFRSADFVLQVAPALRVEH